LLKSLGHSRASRYLVFAAPGVAAGALQMALGVYLGWVENGWDQATFYSVVALIGAPLATLSWASHRPQRQQLFSGLSMLAGVLGMMAIMLEFSGDANAIARTLAGAPLVVGLWFAIWVSWMALALAKLILFQPGHTRRALPR